MEHRLSPDEQLVFVHIPKTAGLTLRGILASRFDARETYPKPDEWWWPHLDDRANVDRYRLFNGHYVHSVGEVLRRPQFVTMLRNPVDRLVSTYHYLLRNPNSFQYGDVTRRSMSLEEFLSDPVIAAAQANWQSGFVASIPARELRVHQESFAVNGGTGGRGERSFYPGLGATVALERLESYAAFGLCERFEDSVFMLDFVFGWKPAVSYQSFNMSGAGARSVDLDRRLVDAVLERNAEDVAFYDRASSIFGERFRAMCELLLERYGDARHARLKLPLPREAVVELLESHYRERYRERHPSPRRSFVWSAAQPLEGAGWHVAEEVAPGIYGRWTGPTRSSTLDVRLERERDYTIEFRVRGAADATLMDGIGLAANGVRLSLRRVFRVSRGGRRFRATLPREAVDRSEDGLVTLEWTVARTVDPRASNPASTDARTLGLMFSEVRVAPLRPSGLRSLRG